MSAGFADAFPFVWFWWRLGWVSHPGKRYIAKVMTRPIGDEIDRIVVEVIYNSDATETVVLEHYRRIAGRLYWRQR